MTVVDIPSPAGSNTTSEIIETIGRWLYSDTRDERNRLNGAVADTTTTTFTVKYDPKGIQRGTRLAVDLELVDVWDVNSMTVTVARAADASVAAIHSDLSTVYVNPKFSRFHRLIAINEELNDLSAPANGLWQVAFVDLTWDAAVQGYNLTGVGDVNDILQVRWQATGTTKRWPLVPRSQWSVTRQMPASTFPSGTAIWLTSAITHGQTVRVFYKKPFNLLPTNDETVDVAATSGLPFSAHDILSLGAAIRLTTGRPIKRADTSTQGEPRRASEVSTGDVLQSPSALRRLRQDRIGAEASRLAAQWAEARR